MSSFHGTTRMAEYARAVLDLADEQGQAEAVGQELTEMAGMVASEPLLSDFLRDPSISPAKRLEIIDRALKGRVSPLVYSLLGVMNARGCAGLVGELASAYKTLLDRKLGRVDLDVSVPQPMDEAFAAELCDRVGKALGKTVRIRQDIDPSLIGGMVLRLEDRLFDASVKTQLRVMKQKLMSAATP